MSVITSWTKESYPGSPSLWAMDVLPWQLSLPWQIAGTSITTWIKEY